MASNGTPVAASAWTTGAPGAEGIRPAEEGEHLRYGDLPGRGWFGRAEAEDLVADHDVLEAGEPGRAGWQLGVVELGAEVLVDQHVRLRAAEVPVDDGQGGHAGRADGTVDRRGQVVGVEDHCIEAEPADQLAVLARCRHRRLHRDPPGRDLLRGPRHRVRVADEHDLDVAPPYLLRQRQTPHHVPDPPPRTDITPHPDALHAPTVSADDPQSAADPG